jgi:4,5-dihydroxyphthalate decarboxylase
MDQQLTLVFGGPYDRIADVPRLAAEAGLQVEIRLLDSPKDAFAAVRDTDEVAGGEMSASFYMTQYSKAKTLSDVIAVPVWISRAFRHGNIYVRSDSGMTSPHDLRGRRIGLPEYGMTMAVWLRGLFSDDYAIQPADIQWVTHRAPAGLSEDAVTYPPDVDIIDATKGLNPQEQLLTGEIDAWIGAGVAPPVAGIRRLFSDVYAEERKYFSRTGIFPIMHVLVLKRAALEQYPDLSGSLFRVFNAAKLRAQKRLWSTSVPYATLPWILEAVEEQTRLMGSDPWPYGLRANAATLSALARYMDEQHLLWDRLAFSDYFLALEPPG